MRGAARLTWPRALAVVVLFAVTLVAAQSCQKAQVRVSQQRAVATARAAVPFEATRMQVRLVRQGITARPYWAVSLSIPNAGGETFRELATVRVDANTGKVDSVDRGSARERPPG